MLNYMLMPFRRYAEFSGRSRRMEFWSYTLFNLIVYAILGVVLVGTMGGMGAFDPTTAAANPGGMFAVLFGGFGLVIGFYVLATFIPTLAVTVRRLHDRDMSGWWYLGFMVLSLIPLVGVIVSIAFLVIMFLPGTPGPNRFGEDPKDPLSAQVFA